MKKYRAKGAANKHECGSGNLQRQLPHHRRGIRDLPRALPTMVWSANGRHLGDLRKTCLTCPKIAPNHASTQVAVAIRDFVSASEATLGVAGVFLLFWSRECIVATKRSARMELGGP